MSTVSIILGDEPRPILQLHVFRGHDQPTTFFAVIPDGVRFDEHDFTVRDRLGRKYRCDANVFFRGGFVFYASGFAVELTDRTHYRRFAGR